MSIGMIDSLPIHGVKGGIRMRSDVRRFFLRAWLVLTACACSGGGGSRGLDTDAPSPADAITEDTVATEEAPALVGDLAPPPFDLGPEAWVFDRDAYARVHGWVLLDSDPQAVSRTIEAAAAYGVNHIQLSHGLIMNIEDLLGDSPEVQARVQVLNQAIALAHEHGMKVTVWAHEFSGTGFEICYAPDSPVWQARARAYREGLARIPDVDGVVLMYGSAPVPPWATACLCSWCLVTGEENPFDTPPQDERIRLITEQVGRVVVGELHKDLFVRTFVHEPAEIAWHSDGLAAVLGLHFTGMHKGPVQDWQPYNPHDPATGHIGPHPSILEEDVAGEYWGLSVLPFCAPGYFRWRLDHLWANRGIGAVVRVQRGSYSALGTPNEVNVLAVRRLIQDPRASLDAIWDEFIESRYGLRPGDPGQDGVRSVLEATFPIRLKSHYALGIWALEKSSDLPDKVGFGQFHERGYMPKWDKDYQDTWDRLARPDRQTIMWLWQEGSEAVDLAQSSLQTFAGIADLLNPDDREDLGLRLSHQWFAARAWRAVDLFLWSSLARNQGLADADLPSFLAWAAQELASVRDEMTQAGLDAVPVAGPTRIQAFLAKAAPLVPPGATPEPPPTALFSPIEVVSLQPDRATLRFSVRRSTHVFVDWGSEIPDYGSVVDAGVVEPGEDAIVTLAGLRPGSRVVARLRADSGGLEHRGGDFWVFVPASGDGGP